MSEHCGIHSRWRTEAAWLAGSGNVMAVHYHLGKFPPSELDWPRLIPLLGPASAAVARYDGILAAIPNAAVLLSPLTTQEAVLSSRLEVTQTTMGEVLEFEAEGDTLGLSEARRDDIREVLNYRAAMRMAEKMLAEVPLSQRVIREAHRVLSLACAVSVGSVKSPPSGK